MKSRGVSFFDAAEAMGVNGITVSNAFRNGGTIPLSRRALTRLRDWLSQLDSEPGAQKQELDDSIFDDEPSEDATENLYGRD